MTGEIPFQAPDSDAIFLEHGFRPDPFRMTTASTRGPLHRVGSARSIPPVVCWNRCGAGDAPHASAFIASPVTGTLSQKD